jgi:hypothetical protein
VPFALYETIKTGMTKAEVLAALKNYGDGKPITQDDGTVISRWPAVNRAGEPRSLDVQWDVSGLVIGAALVRSE